MARPRGRGGCPALLELLIVVWQTSGTIRSFNVAFILERSLAFLLGLLHDDKVLLRYAKILSLA